MSIHGAAIKAIEWFDLNPETVSAHSEENRQSDFPKEDHASRPKPEARKTVLAPEKSSPNPPLKFRLDKLERDHSYLTERGLTLETMEDFGVGFCAKGMMARRIAIPIHNPEGKVVAYAGRFPGEPAKDTPKYKLPPGFKKSLEIFNLT